MIDIDITKTWLYQEGMQEGIQKGRKKGIQEGRKEGIREGIRKGIKQGIIEGMKKGLKEAILSVIKVKFGKTPSSIRKVIMHTDDIDKLRLMKKEILRSKTLREFEKRIRSMNHNSR
ncbi:MAG: hypothetical protein NZ927_04130 [Candidatus Calescibacterium sp.]|nr:hypothetical protein [Candidatus Calescibacterium sp.]